MNLASVACTDREILTSEGGSRICASGEKVAGWRGRESEATTRHIVDTSLRQSRETIMKHYEGVAFGIFVI